MLLLLADVRSEVWIAERNLEKAVTIHLERNLRRVREIWITSRPVPWLR